MQKIDYNSLHTLKRPKDIQQKIDLLMEGNLRIYLDWVIKHKKSKTQLMVEDYISPLGYEVFDYTKGIAIKINGDPKKNNQIRIGKLLKDKNILEKFNLDEDRTNSKKYNTEDYRIVISQSYDDIINMSTGRSWTSCMSFPDGRYSYMIKADILEGTLIAYLINKDDMEITKPLGRVLIKPFSTEDGETQYLTETKVYGNVPMSQSFIRSVKSWLNNRQTPSFEGWVSLKRSCITILLVVQIQDTFIKKVKSYPSWIQEVMIMRGMTKMGMIGKVMTTKEKIKMEYVKMGYINVVMGRS